MGKANEIVKKLEKGAIKLGSEYAGGLRSRYGLAKNASYGAIQNSIKNDLILETISKRGLSVVSSPPVYEFNGKQAEYYMGQSRLSSYGDVGPNQTSHELLFMTPTQNSNESWINATKQGITRAEIFDIKLRAANARHGIGEPPPLPYTGSMPPPLPASPPPLPSSNAFINPVSLETGSKANNLKGMMNSVDYPDSTVHPKVRKSNSYSLEGHGVFPENTAHVAVPMRTKRGFVDPEITLDSASIPIRPLRPLTPSPPPLPPPSPPPSFNKATAREALDPSWALVHVPSVTKPIASTVAKSSTNSADMMQLGIGGGVGFISGYMSTGSFGGALLGAAVGAGGSHYGWRGDGSNLKKMGASSADQVKGIQSGLYGLGGGLASGLAIGIGRKIASTTNQQNEGRGRY